MVEKIKNRLRNLRNKNIKVYLYLIIPLIIYITFFIIPNINTIVYSFFKWDGINPVKEFIGIINYYRLLSDSIFSKSFLNTLKYTITVVGFEFIGGLIIAILIFKKSRINIFFIILIFLSAMFSTVAIGIIWSFIYDSSVGAVNFIFSEIGLDSLKRFWLSDPKIAIFTVASVHIWAAFGYGVILFIAGLQEIPKEVYEAAKVDGVNMWQNFFYITIPMLKSTMLVVSVLATVGGFISFDFVYVMTRGGADHSSQVLATYLYQQGFKFNNVGYSSAIAVILFLIVLSFSILQLRITKEY